MKKLIRKDQKNRQKFFTKEFLAISNKFLFRHLMSITEQSIARKKILYFFLRKKKITYIKARLVRRCVLTGRGRGIFPRFGITRQYLRELLSFGLIQGYKKAVW